MTGFHCLFPAVTHTAQTVLTVIGPIGAFLWAGILHQDGIIGTEPGAHAAADTLVAGKHHFGHKHPGDDQIGDGKNRNQPEQEYTPHNFPKVIEGNQNSLTIQYPGHQQVQP